MPFFEKLLPSEGFVCVARALNKGFAHYFYEDRAEALRQIAALDAQGHTVYLAQATFKTDENRKTENALALRSFFLDIDCGESKDYPDQKAAADDLKRMLAETGLPMPAVVVSGNGLYAYWFLNEQVPAAQWKTVAALLKKTLAAYNFKADPARTSDASSVLRPLGSTHRKDPTNPKKVRLVRDAEPMRFMDFVRILHKAAKKKNIDTAVLTPPKPQKDLNADFYDGIDNGPKSYAALAADKCAQIGSFRDTQGNVDEPLWYAMLGVLNFCEDGEGFAQEWSSGHPDYSPQATQAKTRQWLDSGMGPATCSHIGMVNPQGCIGCKHNGKITSPIQLGRPEPKAKEVNADIGEIEPPKGFMRSENGLQYEEDGEWKTFYDQDLYPVRIAYDESLGYEVVIVRHYLPHEGWLEFPMRTSYVNDMKAFLTCFYDNHVKIVSAKDKKVMVAYMESYMQKLQRSRRMAQLLCQMGWKDIREQHAMFVLGKKVFRADGSVEEAQLARNVPTAAQGFSSSGSLETWTEATRVFDAPNMEPFIFALLSGFGAPLMKFTGFDGALVSLVGNSGAGKTLMLRMILSIFGNHTDLMMMHKDTQNALVSRLGVYGTLPLAIDEVTNIQGNDLSDLAYRVTQGRDKARLTKNSEERKTLNQWNTLAVVSSNSSLIDRLNSLKHDASAEVNRIFEYPVNLNPYFSGKRTTELYWMLHQNYGKVGEVYIKWLVQNTASIKRGIEQIRERIDKNAGIRGDERFWSAVAAATLYGGAIAKKLGLIKFELTTMLPWVCETIKDMRGQKDELADTAVSVLGQFLDEYAANRLILRGDCKQGSTHVPIDVPRGQLVIRHEYDNHKMYISRPVFKTWLAKRFGEYTKIAKELQADGILVSANQRKTLGAGTTLGGAQVPCWVVNLKAPALGAIGLQVIKSAEALAEITRMEEETING